MKKYIVLITLLSSFAMLNNAHAKEVKVCHVTYNRIPNKLKIVCGSDLNGKQTTYKEEYKKGWRFAGAINTKFTQIILEK